ncbi:hypothetical protein DCS_01781 [Drechmeria coniospora]|uniref:Exocyst complex component Sec3 PIP2-binding N-terminal domain-containing protein n=1 Tax=Drechmeria coniospora TaxID=98403 RepID=A0A151GUB2_DRECN|nr:hypothetical protein DCS_01781 [Drechmeria coniospora]KYK60643.1 hypothetical protein DCS_01781 [Drechmeria coniospora]ODA80799.1 hypothetical protein RJ55_03759 [Drechmeria coniospora]
MDRANGPGAAATRAERFEDEKRRIIETCFNKTDVDGSLLETYITHIRITEYSTHPSTPPPPHARTPEAEKPRVIIVAVRKSGRVRMHKSKENPSGSFSIGKSWNLDDLTRIDSYTGPQVSPDNRAWGADTGFLVTLGKPYYWQSQTEKEKKFFIASLIKIYGKYTGGHVPELIGFDQKELDQVLGAGRRQASRPPMPEPTASRQSASSAASAPPPMTIPPPSTSLPEPPRPPMQHANTADPVSGSFESSMSRVPPPTSRWKTDRNRSQDSAVARSDDGSSLPPRSRNGPTGPSALARLGELGGSREPSEPAAEPTPPSLLPSDSRLPPERRRPPMDPSRPQDRDLVPPPLMSPTKKRDGSAPPRRSTDRSSSQREDAAAGQQPILVSLSTSYPRTRTSSESPMAAMSTTNATDTPDTVETPSAADLPDEESRPGLGPMIKSKKSKSDVAGAFWKAASTAAAFRPRPGGAGDRLRQAAQTIQKSTEGPDGITGVVPAPPRPVSRGPAEAATPAELNTNPLEAKLAASSAQRPDSVEAPPAVRKPEKARKEEGRKEEAPKEEAPKDDPRKDDPRRSVVVGNDAKYLQSLGVDPTILDGRSEEFGKWLDYFGWVPGERMRLQTVDGIKMDLDRELNKAQAGGWLARFKEEDERVDAIKLGVDIAMAECEEMDNLLTLYSVELSTLSDDIAYIEAQGQGLQVQAANQKLLKKELESLLDTCAITSTDLEALRVAPLESVRGLEDVEAALVTLFKAMSKMDPTLGADAMPVVDATTDSDRTTGLNNYYGQMRIVQEKKEMYLQENAIFMRRLVEFMARQFDAAFAETRRSLEAALAKKVDTSHYDAGRDLLWKYSPLMLYARDADLDNWNRLMQIYQDMSHSLYKGQFPHIVALWRQNARKMTGEEAELLFSSHVEKQPDGVASTARKLTVKKSHTLARALRSDGGSRTIVDKSSADSRSFPCEIFSGVIEDLLPLAEMEQNFIIDFFHATTLEQIDFPDAAAARAPRDRRGGDLKRHRHMEPDRDLARRVTRSMEVAFAFLEPELRRLMEWVVGQDPLQGVGILAVLERKMTDMSQSNQEYLHTLLQKLYGFLEGRFRKFIDEQIRAIEETKVKINKRKGVIAFIRVFPPFMTAVENMFTGLDSTLSLRRTINGEYDRILKSMFDSLMVIARENPTVGIGGGADPEDKEALNFHILLIENMNHFLEETDTRGLDVLERWKEQAGREYHEHMGLYLNAVMRRPLGKLLDQLENIEAQVRSGKNPAAIAVQPSNNKETFNKMLGSYDSKEVRKGVEALRKRVEKHFGDADDPNLSRALVQKVTKECEAFYNEAENRIGRVTTDVYGGDVAFEWPRADVKLAFR